MTDTSSKVLRRRALRRAASFAAALLLSAYSLTAAYAHDARQTQLSGTQLYASPSQVRIVQEKLRDQNRGPGAIDGVWGERTAAAVRDFQKEKGLAPTGQLDTSLLSVLDLGDVLEGETSSRFLDGLLRSDKSSARMSSGMGTPIYVSPAHVAQIQHLLRERGHYSGAIDGSWGPATAQAANEFRRAAGLEASDKLDIALLRVMDQQRVVVPEFDTVVTARTEGVPLQADPATIRALQRELSQRGHEEVVVDGAWGENTRQALRNFQRAHDLESTGTLTLPTLAALGIDITPNAPDSVASADRD